VRNVSHKAFDTLQIAPTNGGGRFNDKEKIKRRKLTLECYINKSCVTAMRNQFIIDLIKTNCCRSAK